MIILQSGILRVRHRDVTYHPIRHSRSSISHDNLLVLVSILNQTGQKRKNTCFIFILRQTVQNRKNNNKLSCTFLSGETKTKWYRKVFLLRRIFNFLTYKISINHVIFSFITIVMEVGQ